MKITAAPVTGTSYVDGGRSCGATYSYLVTADNGCGSSANSSCSTVTSIPCAIAPGTSSSASISWPNETTLPWPVDSGATNYWTYRGAAAQGSGW